MKKRREKRTGKRGCDYGHLEGVVTFYGSHHALRAEKVLIAGGLEAVLIPGPREISPNCGVALRFDYNRAEECGEILRTNCVQIEAIHRYADS